MVPAGHLSQADALTSELGYNHCSRMTTKKPTPSPARAPKASKYGVGDKVVHPQHGAATIAKKIRQEFAGE